MISLKIRNLEGINHGATQSGKAKKGKDQSETAGIL
jgi:hypothetical protein